MVSFCQLPAESPTHEQSYLDRPKTPLTPLTPGSSKKAFMETLLAPPTMSQDHSYIKDRAVELFMKGHEDIGVTVQNIYIKLTSVREHCKDNLRIRIPFLKDDYMRS